MRPRRLLPLLLLLFAAPALAMYTVGQTVGPDQPLSPETAAERGWPDGVLALVNHPRRTIGWAGFFSELPNDVESFCFDFKTPDDPQTLIDLLAKIKLSPAPPDQPRTLTLILELGRGPKLPFPSTAPAAAELSLGAQKTLDRWFQALPDGKFGVHKLTKPPTAMAPTLTLYVDHEAVDLTKLKVPLSIQVEAGFSVKDAVTPAEKASAAAVTKFIAAHHARRQATSQPTTQPR